MSEPPELWAYLLSNAVVLLLGGALATISFLAYRRSGQRSFRDAAAGFGLITLGSLVEAAYELGIRGSYHISGKELLVLHTVEGVFIAVGLGALFYSLRGH